MTDLPSLPLPTTPSSDAALSALLKFLIATTGATGGTLSIAIDGTPTRLVRVERERANVPAVSGRADQLRFALDDDGRLEAIVALDRLPEQSDVRLLVASLADLLRDQLPRLLAAEATAAELAGLIRECRPAMRAEPCEAQHVVALGSFEHDLITGNVRCSDELFRIMGVNKATFDGKLETLARLVHPDDCRASRAEYYGAIARREPHQFEVRFVRPSGEIAIVRRRGLTIFSDDGVPLRVFATVQDVTEERRREAERLELEIRCTEAFDRAPFGMSMIGARADNYGLFIRVNAAFCLLCRVDATDLIGKPFTLVVAPDDVVTSREATDQLQRGKLDVIRCEIRMMRRDGTVFWVRETRSLMRDARGDALYFFTHTEDITQRRMDQAALTEANARLRRSLDNAPLGMALTGIAGPVSGRFIEVNSALCRLTGFTRADLLGMSFGDLIHPDRRDSSNAAMRRLLSGEEAFCTFEERAVRADGTFGWMCVNASVAYDHAGQALYSVVQMMDITKRKAGEAKLEHLAYHDALTGVLNRRGLASEIKRRFSSSRADAAPAAFLLLDLDHFKYVNDTLGHAAGDRILRKVARILWRTCGAGDIIARLGGDEFVVIACDATEARAVALADRLRAAIQSNIYLSNESGLRATASIGIVMTRVIGQASVDEAVAAADAALATAKAEGRNRSSIARTLASSHTQMKAQLTWSQRIRSALERDGFTLYAQPILNLRSGILERYELLLRMIEPDGRLILPGEFLPVAERAGLMPQIDNWVVKNAVAHAAALQRAGQKVVFEVNLSAASLTNESVTACIERELRSAELDPQALIFEITETATIGKMDQACTFAERISNLGCAFAIDDFGAGFSSFYYLKYLPFDYLKIDGEFIRNFTTNAADQHIVKAIVELARGLGKKTIAEFVGDAQTAALLQAHGVDFAQGYHIGKPAPWGAALLRPDAVTTLV